MKIIKIFFLIIFSILLSINIFCTEFVADLVKNESGLKTIGKIYVKGNKIRIDSEQNGQKSIILNDYDNQKFFLLHPSSKIYLSINLDNKIDFSDPNLKKNIKDSANTKLIGQEKINGYLCEKYQCIYNNSKQVNQLTIWYSTKLKYALKTVYNTNPSIKIELIKIQEKTLDPALFKIPSDYKKIMDLN
jgi:hypothetical protein